MTDVDKRRYQHTLWYPVPREGLRNFVQLLHRAADEKGTPRPDVRPPPPVELWRQKMKKYTSGAFSQEGDHVVFEPAPNEKGYGSEFLVVEVEWYLDYHAGLPPGPGPQEMWKEIVGLAV